MGMQTDVKASKVLAVSGAFLNQDNRAIGRCRIKGIYAVNAAAAGSVVITDGVGGTPLLPIDTSAIANMGFTAFAVPGQGILCANGPAGVLTGVASVIIFYG